ncbi:MAG: LysR family transcriptional regulator, partial [Bdellovibrionales bacterium]|nr:LysR family transcriptional regulator [Bdellovibrionales bacterium]NQZ18740.1 LysR family transcriptional regulator [Bdellovibrionales bacterium]
MENLNGIDFNLIKHLEALLRIKNISRAAEDIGITQPAMSNSFSRLKKQFDDELLVRTKQGYRLTPLAESLQPKVEILLKNFKATLVDRDSFDPKKDHRTFNVIVSDSAGFVLAPMLMAHISNHYPNIELNLLPMEENHSLNQLENDDISLAITSTIVQDFSEKLYTKVLREDPFAVAGCDDLYKHHSSISFDEYLHASHYAVT